MSATNQLFTILEASQWASKRFNRKITPTNISYLIQYGHSRKTNDNGSAKVYQEDLEKYFSYQNIIEKKWKKELGEDLNWHLSFDKVKEKERTKHVHRLHPYKGKFIPQLVEYFLDTKTDNFKTEVFFQPGDIVLDPFCGSGTTLVQANELGIHAIGIDISHFNSLISNVKVGKHNIFRMQKEIKRISQELAKFVAENKWSNFENELLDEMKIFNDKYFPVPGYRFKVRNKEINHVKYGLEKEKEFQPIFNKLVEKYNIQIEQQTNDDSFLSTWYLPVTVPYIDWVNSLVDEIEDQDTREVIQIILSRTIRSCRATTHADLATLLNIVKAPYYCRKHYKICKPLFSMHSWWERYSQDTINRIIKFNTIRTNTFQKCLVGDSRKIELFSSLKKVDIEFSKLAEGVKIRGIFSSPPYLGLINYHEQHAYAYDLYGFDRKDKLEIGPLFKGKGLTARESYVDGVSEVLVNSLKYLVDDFDIFLVANDKFGLYPKIAGRSGLQIVREYKRPVLNRTEKDKSAYSEIIFHMKKA